MITRFVVKSDNFLETFDSYKFSYSSSSLSYFFWSAACLYNFTILISLTSLTTLPALVPTLEALPALANDAVSVAFPLDPSPVRPIA